MSIARMRAIVPSDTRSSNPSGPPFIRDVIDRTRRWWLNAIWFRTVVAACRQVAYRPYIDGLYTTRKRLPTTSICGIAQIVHLQEHLTLVPARAERRERSVQHRTCFQVMALFSDHSLHADEGGSDSKIEWTASASLNRGS